MQARQKDAVSGAEEREDIGCQTETESRGKKRERRADRDIINDFSVVISVFTDLESSLRFLFARSILFLFA